MDTACAAESNRMVSNGLQSHNAFHYRAETYRILRNGPYATVTDRNTSSTKSVLTDAVCPTDRNTTSLYARDFP